MRNVRLLLLALAALPGAAAAASFDGSWAVSLDCPRTPNGVEPYHYNFSATVKGGALHGQHGSKGLPGSLTIVGRVAEDGAVNFHANGIVRVPDTALRHLHTGTPYAYEAAGRFEGGHGEAHRTSGRRCDYRFSR